MSGGSLDYISFKIDETIDTILKRSKNPLHMTFAKHLKKVSEALYILEWVYSGDSSEPDEENALRQVLTPSDELNSAMEEAEKALKDLTSAIEYASNHEKRKYE